MYMNTTCKLLTVTVKPEMSSGWFLCHLGRKYWIRSMFYRLWSPHGNTKYRKTRYPVHKYQAGNRRQV